MFEPKGQRVSLLCVGHRMGTGGPACFLSGSPPHACVVPALDQEGLSKWIWFLSVCLLLAPSDLPFLLYLSPSSSSPSHLLPLPSFFLSFLKNTRQEFLMRSDGPSHCLIFCENYSYVFSSPSSFESSTTIPTFLVTGAN